MRSTQDNMSAGPASRRRVLILHTGGTLGMVGGHPGPLTPGAEPVGALLERIPELSEIAELRIEVLARQDSCDVTSDQWIAWAERIRREPWADGIVIIHGTDTMVYTACMLSFLLEERVRPIILTGSQRPLSAVRNDARQNLVDACILAGSDLREVLLCFDSEGLRGNRSLKRSSTAMRAFESPNCPPLVNLGVDIQWQVHGLRSGGTPRALSLSDRVRLSWIVPDLAAPDPWEPRGPAVHVLATLGSGNFPRHRGWQALVEREAAHGVHHLVVTQSWHGGTLADAYQSAAEMDALGVIQGADMTYVAALVKARVGLGQGFSGAELRDYLQQNVAGERSPGPPGQTLPGPVERALPGAVRDSRQA